MTRCEICGISGQNYYTLNKIQAKKIGLKSKSKAIICIPCFKKLEEEQEFRDRYGEKSGIVMKFIDAYDKYYDRGGTNTPRKHRIFLLCQEILGYGIKENEIEKIENLRRRYSSHWLVSRRIILDYIHESFDVIIGVMSP